MINNYEICFRLNMKRISDFFKPKAKKRIGESSSSEAQMISEAPIISAAANNNITEPGRSEALISSKAPIRSDSEAPISSAAPNRADPGRLEDPNSSAAPNSTYPGRFTDIPDVLKLTGHTSLGLLDAKEKYRFLNEKFLPDTTFNFPKKEYSRKYNGKDIKEYRSFKPHHITDLGEQGKGFHYSCSLQKIFCLDCAFFTPISHKSHYKTTLWTETGVDDWKRISEKMNVHIKTENHINCALERINFMKIQEGRLSSLESTFKSQRQQNKDKNTELLTGCIYVTKLLGTQGMAFRGHRESFDPDNPHANNGNFLETMDMLGNYSDVIHENINIRKEKKGAITMMSWKVQNDLINIIGMLLKLLNSFYHKN